LIPLPESASVLCALLICALPLAIAGLALVYAGFSGARHSSQVLIGSVSLLAVAAVVYFVIGFSWQGYPGGPSYAMQFGSTTWDWIGALRLFFHGLDWNGTAACFIAGFQILAVGIAAIIPWGASAGRWRLSAAAISTVLLAGLFYPLFAHWVWGGGWLAHLGIGFNLGGGFVDPGGAATIQVIGAVSALTVLWILGQSDTGIAIPALEGPSQGHRELYLAAGCLFAFVGWLALNSLGAVLYTGLTSDGLVAVVINTLLCASGSLLVALVLARISSPKPDVSLSAKAWMAGLVASSAVAAYVMPGSAFIIGLLTGVITLAAQWLLQVFCDLDDPAGAVAVHGVAGIWGLFALGLFSNLPAGQTLAQLVGIGTLVGLMLPVIYGVNWLLDRNVIHYRSATEFE
jgi:Amt family ammonium transporter